MADLSITNAGAVSAVRPVGGAEGAAGTLAAMTEAAAASPWITSAQREALGLAASSASLSIEAAAAAIGALAPTPLGSVALERAALEFGREARSLLIGHPDRAPSELAQALANARQAGLEAATASLAGHGSTDRAVAAFEAATADLSRFSRPTRDHP